MSKYLVHASVRDDNAPEESRFKEIITDIETDKDLVNEDGSLFTDGIYEVQRQIGLEGNYASVLINKVAVEAVDAD